MLQAEKKVAPKLSSRLGRCEVSNGRDIRKGNAGIGAGLEGSFFSFEETSLVVLNLTCERGIEGKAAEWAYGGMTQGASTLLPTLLALSRYFSARRGNTRIPYSWNVPLVLGYKSILHCHGVSDKVLCSRNPK